MQRTGVSTEPVVKAAQHFLSTLSDNQRAAVTFGVDAREWRTWLNWYPYVVRHGLCSSNSTAGSARRRWR